MGKYFGSLEDFGRYDPALTRRLNHEFGFEWISSGVLHQAFHAVAHAELVDAGFVMTRPGRYARKCGSGTDIIHCVRWQEYRSHAGLEWGICLAFLPRVSTSGRIRWKRSLKSADMDIVIQINNDVILNGEAPGQFHELYPPLSHGDRAFRHFTAVSWKLQKPVMFRYLDDLVNVSAVLDYIDLMLDQPVSRDWHHWHVPRTFCKARLGLIGETEAGKELDEYYAPWETEEAFRNTASRQKQGTKNALTRLFSPS